MLKNFSLFALKDRVHGRTNYVLSSWPAHLFLGILGFLLPRAVIMGQLYPFGLAFLASVIVFNRGLGLTVLFSSIAGALTAVGGWQLLSYLASYVIIYAILYRQRSNSGHWALVPGLVLAVDLLVRGIFNYLTVNQMYLWIGVAFEGLFAAVLTVVSSVSLRAGVKLVKSQPLTVDEKTGLGLIILGSLVGINGVEILGLGLQSILSRWLVLWGALLGGPGGGAAVGVAVGLIPSIQGNLATGPIAFHALSGLLGGVFHSFNKTGVMIGFSLGNLLMTLFFSEQPVIVQSLWESGIALALFLIIKNPGGKLGLQAVPHSDASGKDSTRLVQRLKKVSRVFRELEGIFPIQGKKQEKSEVQEIFDKVASRVCEGCSLRKICWDQEFYKTYRAMLEACATLERKAAITEKDFGTSLKRRCVRLRELSSVLNNQLEMHLAVSNYERRMEECGSLLKSQLAGISRLLENYAEELDRTALDNSELGDYLKDKLQEKGITVKNVEVLEKPDAVYEITVTLVPCQDKSWCRSLIAPNISQALGSTYAVNIQSCHDSTENGSCRCVLTPKRAFRINTGKSQCPKDGFEVCGDTCSVLELPEHRTVLIMSDGMGAGPEALEESKTAIQLLGKLLSLGISTEIAVKTVNTALFIRSGRENFATLDVMMFNGVNGIADFIKIGGAPSLICSENGIKIIKSSTPPAGILDNIELHTERQVLAPGEMIIMMSDGVWEAIFESREWLNAVIRQISHNSPQKIASYLLYLAKKATENKARDDMCIQVAVIEEEEN